MRRLRASAKHQVHFCAPPPSPTHIPSGAVQRVVRRGPVDHLRGGCGNAAIGGAVCQGCCCFADPPPPFPHLVSPFLPSSLASPPLPPCFLFGRHRDVQEPAAADLRPASGQALSPSSLPSPIRHRDVQEPAAADLRPASGQALPGVLHSVVRLPRGNEKKKNVSCFYITGRLLCFFGAMICLPNREPYTLHLRYDARVWWVWRWRRPRPPRRSP